MELTDEIMAWFIFGMTFAIGLFIGWTIGFDRAWKLAMKGKDRRNNERRQVCTR